MERGVREEALRESECPEAREDLRRVRPTGGAGRPEMRRNHFAEPLPRAGRTGAAATTRRTLLRSTRGRAVQPRPAFVARRARRTAPSRARRAARPADECRTARSA